MYELTTADRVVLAAAGDDGLPFSELRKLTDADRLESLCDAGYLWAADPVYGPCYVLSERGREALDAEPTVAGAALAFEPA